MDKVAMYEELIYQSAMEKEAAPIGALLGGAKKVLGDFAGKSLAKRIGIGAAAGAGLGALTAKPTVDENGKVKSNRLNGALSGVTSGALAGALLGKSNSVKPTSEATKMISATKTTVPQITQKETANIFNTIPKPKAIQWA